MASAPRPLRFTKVGVVVGALANARFRDRPVPALAWYAGAQLHWPVVGAVIDLLRAMRRAMQTGRRSGAGDAASAADHR